MDWYDTKVAKNISEGIAIGIAAFCILYGAGSCDEFRNREKIERHRITVEAASRIEYQRLRAIEEITRAHGDKVTLEQLGLFFDENGLRQRE